MCMKLSVFVIEVATEIVTFPWTVKSLQKAETAIKGQVRNYTAPQFFLYVYKYV